MKRKRRNVKKLLKELIVEAFATGETVTKYGLALALGYSKKDAIGANGVYKCLLTWEARGLMTVQVAPNGPGYSPHTFNFTGRPLLDCTLADGLAVLFSDDEVPAWRASHVRSALRFLLGLPTKCVEAVIIDAVAQIPIAEFHGMAERVRQLTIADRKAKNTADVRHDAMVFMFRYCASRDLIPMQFPLFREDDVWQSSISRYFPLEIELKISGQSSPFDAELRSTHRTALRHYREAAELAFGPEGERIADPANASLDDVEELRKAIIRDGRPQLWSEIKGALNAIGAEFGVGPMAKRQSGRREPDYLYPAENVSVSRYDGFLQLFDHHGFPPEFRKFFEAYYEIQTLPFKDLDAREDLPNRRTAPVLSDLTLRNHTLAVRAWLGIAVNRLKLKPAELTLADVFGHMFRDIFVALRKRWEEKAQDPHSTVSGDSTAGLHNIVVNVGLVAIHLWRYKRNGGGEQHKTIQAARPSQELRTLRLEEERLPMTADESAIYQAYVNSREYASAINLDRLETGDPDSINTLKDLRENFERTPPSYWQALFEEQVSHVKKLLRTGRDDDELHESVLATMLTASFISGGPRACEPTHLRLNRHYKPANREQRQFTLYRSDRKNKHGHVIVFWGEVPPRWLEDLYLRRTRPFLMAKTGANHDFFYVDPQGRPWGCPEEDEHGRGRDVIAHHERVKVMSAFWKRHAAAAAKRAELEIPTDVYSFSLHTIRGVFGYLIFNVAGIAGAMNYLGDHSSSAVIEHYTALSGHGVPEKEIRVLAALGAPTSFRPATNTVPSLAEFNEACDQLDVALAKGRLTPAGHAAHLAKLKAAHGLG